MNQLVRLADSDGLFDPIDTLLADVAIRIQLAPSDQRKAEQRYATINDHLERAGSLLRGHVELLYPQGSMAVGATIASRLRTDEFDIDILAQLALPPDTAPAIALNILYHSIRGERGSRYYDMTTRNTRCVTVNYADAMHLDITAAVLLAARQPKTSVLFHHKADDPTAPSYRLAANPWGFAEWFKACTPMDHAFAKSFSRRAALWERTILPKAMAEPVPAPQEAHEKSKAVIVLQLLKRWRNVQYDGRKDMRRPPSVMLAKLVAEAANCTSTLCEELVHQARHLRQVIDAAHSRREKVTIANPACPDDCFTDRWPESLQDQSRFLKDIDVLLGKLEVLPTCDLAEMRDILSDLFGENPTGAVFESYNQQLGQSIATGRSLHVPGSGRVLMATAARPASATPTRAHTFFGRPPP